MQYNKEEQTKKIKTKAEFYFEKNLKCHIKVVPTNFINGRFLSELIDDKYFWFEDLRKLGKRERLFLVDIFEINDYEELKWSKKE